jgi:hypothetical protein
MIDKILNIIFWIGFLLLGLVGVVGLAVGASLLCLIIMAAVFLGCGALIIMVVPAMPFICWCAMFERQRWESFIRMIQSQKSTTN